MTISKKYLQNILLIKIEDVIFEGKSIETFINLLDENSKFGEKNILLSMPNIVYLDSAALTAIVNYFNKLKDNKGDLKIVSPKESARKIFDLTKLSKTIEIFDDEETAIESFTCHSELA